MKWMGIIIGLGLWLGGSKPNIERKAASEGKVVYLLYFSYDNAADKYSQLTQAFEEKQGVLACRCFPQNAYCELEVIPQITPYYISQIVQSVGIQWREPQNR